MARLAILILLIFSFPSVAEEDLKNKCVVHDHGGGSTIIACPEYIITKTPEKTTICRLRDSVPTPICTVVP